jgi:hypothetical protein
LAFEKIVELVDVEFVIERFPPGEPPDWESVRPARSSMNESRSQDSDQFPISPSENIPQISDRVTVTAVKKTAEFDRTVVPFQTRRSPLQSPEITAGLASVTFVRSTRVPVAEVTSSSSWDVEWDGTAEPNTVDWFRKRYAGPSMLNSADCARKTMVQLENARPADVGSD